MSYNLFIIFRISFYLLMNICDIQPFYNFVFDQDVEFCGLFQKNNGCLDIDPSSLTSGYKTAVGRNACQHEKYARIIWHTHPSLAHSYPSKEDIFKVLKHGIEKSVIFTRWGIWQIIFPGKIELNWKNEAKKINEFEKKLYKHTEKGRAVELEGLDAINEYQDNIEHIYPNLTIRFDRWNDVYKNKIFI